MHAPWCQNEKGSNISKSWLEAETHLLSKNGHGKPACLSGMVQFRETGTRAIHNLSQQGSKAELVVHQTSKQPVGVHHVTIQLITQRGRAPKNCHNSGFVGAIVEFMQAAEIWGNQAGGWENTSLTSESLGQNENERQRSNKILDAGTHTKWAPGP